jgi:hypothetical protein
VSRGLCLRVPSMSAIGRGVLFEVGMTLVDCEV